MLLGLRLMVSRFAAVLVQAAKVGGGVGHGAQDVLDGLDDLVDEDLPELELFAMAMPQELPKSSTKA